MKQISLSDLKLESYQIVDKQKISNSIIRKFHSYSNNIHKSMLEYTYDTDTIKSWIKNEISKT